MSDLKIAPASSSGILLPLTLAAVALGAVAGAVFYLNPHKVADLKVAGIETYAPHTTFSAVDGPTAHGMHVLGAATTTSEDDLYVIATVRLTDHLSQPLTITGATARVTFADGSEAEASLMSSTDLKRLEVIFPDLGQHAVAPIMDGEEVAGGQTRVGTLVLSFPGQTAAAWHNKKTATLTVDLLNRDSQKVLLP